MEQLMKKAENFIDAHAMLAQGDTVVIGVSAGADSMCLLHLLLHLRTRRGLKLCVVHVNHGLRGEAADGDEAFVRAYCAQAGVPILCYHADVARLARAQKLSVEEAGRNYRYACFADALRTLGQPNGKIAVAHQMDDAAETVLWNLLRGTGVAGLAGIPPVRGNIIRPLLCLRRTEIEQILAEEGIRFRTDATNLQAVYTRSRLRMDVLPYLTEHINSQSIRHLYEMAMDAAEVRELLAAEADCVRRDVRLADGSLQARALGKLPKAVAAEVIRSWLQEQTGSLKDMTREHYRAIRSLADKPAGKQICLPGGLRICRGADNIYLSRTDAGTGRQAGCADGAAAASPAGSMQTQELSLRLPQARGESITFDYPDGSAEVMLTLDVKPQNLKIEGNLYTKWLDCDKITFGLKLRHRKSGDFLVMDAAGSRKLLRRYFIDQKIPAGERDTLWLLADGEHIVYLPDGRISSAYKVTPQTKTVLKIEVSPKENTKNARHAGDIRDGGTDQAFGGSK